MIHSGATPPRCLFRGKSKNHIKVHECHSDCMFVTLQIIILLLMRQYPGSKSYKANEGCYHAHSVHENVNKTASSHWVMGTTPGKPSLKKPAGPRLIQTLPRLLTTCMLETENTQTPRAQIRDFPSSKGTAWAASGIRLSMVVLFR